MSKNYRFETLQLHVGQETPDSATDARAVPIYATTSYVFPDSATAAARFALAEPGNIYSRLMNPTTDVFEKRMAALEGGVAALAVASGSAAIDYAIRALAKAGGHVVASSALYGGTYNLLAHTLRESGIETSFVDVSDPAAIEAAIRPETKLIYAETLGNPNSEVADIDALDWAAHANRFPAIAKPNPSYHGLVFSEACGAAACAVSIRATLLRDQGATLSPFHSFLLLQGLETLSLRVERHVQNALRIVQFLREHPQVERVNHPSEPTRADHALYERYFPQGGGSIFTFEIKGGAEAARRFCESLELFSLLANVADVKSLVIHPASTTHSQMNEQELAACGIAPSTVRLSIGTEHVLDLIEDLSQAFDRVK